MIRVCLLTLICDVCAVCVTWRLWPGGEPPTCRCVCVCVQRNSTVLWKERWNVSPQIWKPCFNPSLWQSDEVLAVCLGPLVLLLLLLLFFHWHHLSTFSISSPLPPSPPSLHPRPKRKGARDPSAGAPAAEGWASTEGSPGGRIRRGGDEEGGEVGRWLQPQPGHQDGPLRPVWYFLQSWTFCKPFLNLNLITQVFIYGDFLLYNCKNTKSILGGKRDRPNVNEQQTV